MAATKFRAFVPPLLEADAREEIGERIIEAIIKRSKKGISKFNKPWPGKAKEYTKGYTKSLEFKVAGKRKKPVNLTLSGDMLDSMEIIKHGQGFIEIGYGDDNPEREKADGNNLGSYGKGTSKTGKAREFIGMPQKDIDAIIREFQTEFPEEREAAAAIRREEGITEDEIAESIAQNILRELLGG